MTLHKKRKNKIITLEMKTWKRNLEKKRLMSKEENMRKKRNKKEMTPEPVQKNWS